MADLSVTVAGRSLEAIWTDDAPETKAALESALPVAGDGIRWGDELYFDLALDAPPENAREVVPEGAIAYWPAGGKLCLFWGETPASNARSERSEDLGTASGDGRNREPEGEPRAAAPVTVVALLEDVSPLSDLEGGAKMRLEAVD